MWWWIIGSLILLVLGILVVLFLSGVSKQDHEEEPEPVLKNWNEDEDINLLNMTERIEPEIDEEDKR